MRYALLTAACLLFPLASGTVAGDESEWGYSRIQVEGAAYELRCRRIDVTLQHGWSGELFVYRVYRNGRFVRSLELEGAGRFVGCTYASQGRKGAPVEAEPFPDAENPIGWMLLSGAICGNTHSKRVCLVTVRERDVSHKEPDTYRETRFVSKARPIVRLRGDDIEVWTAEQDGRQGTAVSFFVPALHLVDPQGRVRSADLPADLDAWPAKAWGKSALGLLVAGMRMERPELMRTGLDLVSWGADGMQALLEIHDLPTTPDAMEELVAAVGELARARARVDLLAGDDFP